MNVIVYTRPRIKTFFHELAKNIACFKDVHFMSDHMGEESICIMEYYYVAKVDLERRRNFPKNTFDFDRIVMRCRYLRSLDPDVALLRAKAMTLAIERIVDKYKPDVVFGMVMDSYILDIVDQVMRERNSQYVGFLNNMINGYSRLTARGELIQLSDPSMEMIEKALNELRIKNYLPNMQKDFMWDTSPWSMYFSKYIKEKIKVIYYFFKKLIDRDPDNFYYNTVAAKHCMSCRKIDQIFFRRFENKRWLEFIEAAKNNNKLIVYLPLQFYPECSVDYWGTHSQFSSFYSVVEQLTANRYKKMILLVKEHPSAMGLRRSHFYEKLIKNVDIILTPFDVPSNDVILQSDLVLTWTGSVGVEAIMRNKPLVTFGHAYYDPGYGILKLQEEESLQNLEDMLIKHYQEASYDKQQFQKDVVSHMLKGLIPGYIFPLDYQTKKNPHNPLQMKLLSEGINDFIVKIKHDGAYEVRKGCV
jgi:hypothetical protein